MIAIKKVNKKFGKLKVLIDISTEFAPTKSYAIIGPNGSGKTTLIKCVLGMVLPDSGEIEVNGKNIADQWMYRQAIGYMPQIGRYPDNMRMGQLFDMIRDLRQDHTATDDELITDFGLHGLFDKRMHTLSGGTRQKVSGALAFLFEPSVFILDEPTAGLDPLSVEILKAKILKERGNGKMVLITSHIMSDLDELASDVVYIEDGVIQYVNTIHQLKSETGEEKLGRSIAAIMRRNLRAGA